MIHFNKITQNLKMNMGPALPEIANEQDFDFQSFIKAPNYYG